MWGELLRGLLTTLRFLAPAAVFALFCAQDTVLLALRQLDCAVRSVIYPSKEQASLVLQWLSEVSPVPLTSLAQIWRHGWLLCEVLNRELPGACGGHREGELSIEHAQSLAENYLGLKPVFSRKDFACLTLSPRQEFELVSYINRIRQALSKLTPSTYKPSAVRIHHGYEDYTLDYVARGMGLCVAQTNKKISFKIYPTDQQCLEPGKVDIRISGPKGTFSKAVAPPLYSRAQLLRQAFYGSNSEFTQDSRATNHGATYIRSSEKSDFRKTSSIRKQDIEIEISVRRDHIRVAYLPTKAGVYEIYVTSRGYNVIGSPFRVYTSEDSIESSSSTRTSETSDENETMSIDEKSKKRVVLRIVDFGTEKMIVNENGSLDKITEEEAKKLIEKRLDFPQEALLHTDNKKMEFIDSIKQGVNADCHRRTRFKEAAKKITTTIEVCELFRSTLKNIGEAKLQCIPKTHEDNGKNCRCIIPDIIVHSMILDNNTCRAKETQTSEIVEISSTENDDTRKESSSQSYSPEIKDDDFISDHKLPKIQLHSSNPFIYDISKEGEVLDIPLRMRPGNNQSNVYSFPDTPDVHENTMSTCKSDNKTVRIVTENLSDIITHCNPFLLTDTVLERPKTPILKIISGHLTERPDSPFIDPNYDIERDAKLECIGSDGDYPNNFYVDQNTKVDIYLPRNDIQIEAMVSSSPFLKPYSPEPEIDSIVFTLNHQEALQKYDQKVQCIKKVQTKSKSEPNIVPATPFHIKCEKISSQEIYDGSNTNSYNISYTNESMTDYVESNNELKLILQKDLCDSAYWIDNLPVNNANEIKQFRNDQYALNDIPRDNFLKMGPAESEIWQKIADENSISKKNYISVTFKGRSPTTTNLFDNASKTYTASIPKQTTDLETEEHSATNLMTETVTELNNCGKHMLSTESLSLNTDPEIKIFADRELHFTLHDNDNVNSASEITSDVKRHNEIQEEVAISEVQSHATESFSASRALDDIFFNSSEYIPPWDDQKMFGDNNVNFVMESKKFWDRKIKALQELRAQEEKKWQLIFKSPKKDQDDKNKKSLLLREIPVAIEDTFEISPELRAEMKLVNKWKKYWDEILENNEDRNKPISKNGQPKKIKKSNIHKDKAENESICCDTTITPAVKIKDNSSYVYLADSTEPNNEPSIQTENRAKDIYDKQKEKDSHPDNGSLVKVDTDKTDENLFKAFEINPKTFFGNSRRNILGKIEAFAENHGTENGNQHSQNSPKDIANIGIVSNIISRFDVHKNKNSLNEIKYIQTTTSEKQQSSTTYRNLGAVLSINNYANGKKEVDHSLQWPRACQSNCNEYDTNKVCDISDIIEHISGSDCEYKTTLNTNKQKQSVTDRYLHKISDNNKCSKDMDLIKCHSKIVTKQNHTRDNVEVETVTQHGRALRNHENLTTSETAEGNIKISKLKKTPSKSVTDLLMQTDSKHNGTNKSCKELYSVKVRNFIPIFENSLKLKSEEKGDNSNLSRQSVNTPKSLNTCTTALKGKGLDSQSAVIYDDLSHYNKKATEDKITAATIHDTSADDTEKFTNMQHVDPESDTEEYRIRFNMAKDFFKSLEEISNIKKERSHNLNECELMLFSPESPMLTTKKKKTLHVSLAPASDSEYEMNACDENKNLGTCANGRKLFKISDKLQVGNLFNDVGSDGKISRRGSFKGIPQRQAVLATFKSMENITHMTSYEITESQLSELARENKIKDAQTHLTEYPYLPNTDPSKCQSRLDNRANGLISRKELLKQNIIQRRNSVPNYQTQRKVFSRNVN